MASAPDLQRVWPGTRNIALDLIIISQMKATAQFTAAGQGS
jgi:hypothetical protein